LIRGDQGDAYFDNDVRFNTVSFAGSHFGKQCLFTGAALPSGLNFSWVRVDGLLSFANASLSEDVMLDGSIVNSVSLEIDPNSSPRQLNLKGFTYGQLTGQWKKLFRLVPDDPKAKTHLQAYTQLEKYFHSVGYDRDADEVYLARRKKEWEMIWGNVVGRRSESQESWFHSFFRFLEDSVVRFIFSYGVPSYRLLAFASVLVVAGVAMLCLPCAVRLGDRGVDSSELNMWNRIIAAVGAFFAGLIPGVSKITDWRPSFERMYANGPQFTQCAAALSLVIYGCVSISLASLAGLIKRKQG